MQKLNWQYKVSRMSDDRLPAMVDKAAWELLDTEGFGGFKKKVKEMLESREEATLWKKVRSEDHLEIYGKLKEGIGMKRCDMDKFGKLDNSEKTIAVIGDRWWAQEAVEDGDNMCKEFLRRLWQKRKELPNVGVVSLVGVGTVLRLERDAWSMVK
ncbi:unnamed protein product [Ectocarpus sp. CCAP 1310/34]|nr:unnamed protein product [Ectocarpus sp. CCAP 1310/34]